MAMTRGKKIGGIIGLILALLLGGTLLTQFVGNSEPSTLSADAAASEAYIKSVLESLPADERTVLQKQLDFITSAADESLKDPLERGDIPRIAQIAQEGVIARDSLVATWTKMKSDTNAASDGEPNTGRELDGQIGFGDIARRVMQPTRPITLPADKALIVKAFLVAGSTIERAMNASPIVKESLARLEKLPPNDRTGDAARIMAANISQNEPCFGLKSKSTPAQPNSVRGVSVGMTLDQALANLCAAEKNAIRYIGFGPDKQKSFVAFRDSRFRSGNGVGGEFWREFDPEDRRNTEAMRSTQLSADVNAIRARLGKDYIYAVSICLNCKFADPESSEKEPNILKLTFLPNGQIAKITRIERFVDFVDIPAGDGSTRREERVIPQTLKNLDIALRNDFGEPSFLTTIPASNKIELVYGWVLPDGNQRLPQEIWYSPKWSRIELNGDGLIYDKSELSRNKLIKLNPRSTFCIANAFEFPLNAVGLEAFFKYDSSQSYLDKTFQDTSSSESAGKYAAAGATDNCGTVLLAKLTVDATPPESDTVFGNPSPFDGDDGDIRKMLKRAAPIIEYSISVTNIDMIRNSFRAEQVIVDKAYADLQRTLGKAAQARSGAFVP